MSIYHQDQPAAIDSFRRNTGNQAAMAGVATGRFICRSCNKSKTLPGRKRITKHHKDGYVCADCARGAENA